MGQGASYHLLGNPDEPRLILLAGPDHRKVQEIIRIAGIAFKFLYVGDVESVEALKSEIALRREPIVVFGGLPEVEGTLDRSAFHNRINPLMIDVAYAADLVIYAGATDTVIVHPLTPGATLRVSNGSLQVRQSLYTVSGDTSAMGLTAGRS